MTLPSRELIPSSSVKRLERGINEQTAIAGYNVSVLLDLESIPEDWEQTVRLVGLLKRNCFASVFERYFRLQADGDVGQQRAVINYRQDETL